MRGTLVDEHERSFRPGIIPAHAGNTTLLAASPHAPGDHPRACGEHPAVLALAGWTVGSSPRMRGTRDGRWRLDRGTGIIPAHAGNTWCLYGRTPLQWDHPRACGEHEPATRAYCCAVGSSPRMRGTPTKARMRRSENGIIPAHAGNTGRVFLKIVQPRDHPRACGEHFRADLKPGGYPGSSPRMRGTLPQRISGGYADRIIPAHAGNTQAIGLTFVR